VHEKTVGGSIKQDDIRVKRRIFNTAERLVHLRRCSINDVCKYEKILEEINEDRYGFQDLLNRAKDNIPHFEKQIEQMINEFDLVVDLENDRVKYKDPKLNKELRIEY